MNRPAPAAPQLASILGQIPPRPLLVGLAGPSGCGKSTTACLLAGGGGWARVSFADPLRELFLALNPDKDLWHVGPGKDLTPATGGLSPRECLRVMGDWAKAYEPGFFVAAAYDSIRRHWREGRHVVIDDVRFEAEAEAIRVLDGFLCHISRQEVQFRRDHNSEMGIDPQPGDLHLRNWGGLQALQGELGHVLASLMGQAMSLPPLREPWAGDLPRPRRFQGHDWANDLRYQRQSAQ